jgi:hypothetical protein
VSCEATDYNLTLDGFDCPVPPSDQWSFGYQSASWFLSMIRSTDLFGMSRPEPEKLERISSGTLTLTDAEKSMTVCDSFNNCTEIVADPQAGIMAGMGASAVITPTLPQVFTDLNSIPMGGYVRAEDGLQSLAVNVGVTPVYTESWTNNEVEDTWTAVYTPTAEGIYPVDPTLLDRNAVVITDTALPRIYVDLTPPEVSLTTTGFGPADSLPGGLLVVSGMVTESVALKRLQVRLGDDDWQDLVLPTMPAASTPFSTTISSGLNGALNGESFTIWLRATDIAGRTDEISRTLTADNTRPTLGTLDMEYQHGGSPVAILPGETVSDEQNPSLSIVWTSASDVSGIARYFAGWTNSPTPNLAELTEYTAGATSHTESFSDVERLWAHFVAEDLLGNRTVRSLGPVYVDHGLTPAYISMDEFGLPYRGYMTDACSQIGLDNRISWQSQGDTNKNDPQQFYLTWDSNGLRMTWTGANWDTDGDLFIYLDTQAGTGSNQAYDPFPATSDNTTILLPKRSGSPIGADYLIWVQDSQTASLLRWDGADWQVDTGDWSIVVDANMASPHTDFYLPFATLGISNPATNPLGLIALASEESQLRLWATMPPNNSLTSERIVSSAAMPDELTLRLRGAYYWEGMADGICPRGLDARVAAALSLGAIALADQPLQFSGADVAVKLSADFPGLISGFYGDNLFFLGEDNDGTAGGLGAEKDMAMPSLGNGDIVTYTLRFVNRGTGPSTGLTFLVRSSGGLRLVGSSNGGTELRLDAGELAAGAESELTFQASLDQASLAADTFRWENLSVIAYDGTGTPDDGWIEKITVEHQIDVEPPRHIAITDPVAVINSGTITFRGIVTDYSPVPTIELEVRNGATAICSDPTPEDRTWDCQIDIDAADGALVEVRARATDSHGLLGDWGEWTSFVVDTSAPTVRIDTMTELALADGLIGPSEATISGTISDNRLPASVFVCNADNDDCEEASLVLDASEDNPKVTVDDQPDTPVDLSGIPACGVDTLTRELVVDTDLTIADIDLGLTVSEVQHGQISVALTSPTGTTASLIAARNNGVGQGYNLTLDDATNLLVRDDTSVHSLADSFSASAAPYPDRLSGFNGEEARGTWSLAICNGSGGAISGEYIAAALKLTAQTTPEDLSGSWSYNISIPEGTDGVTRRLQIYAVDSVGNSSQSTPIEHTLTLDNVAPTLTLSDVQVGADGLLRLTGTSGDTSQVTALRMKLRTPAGTMLGATIGGAAQTAGLANASSPWSYTASDPLGPSGIYKLWIEAEDAVGNTTLVAADDLNWVNPERISGTTIYMPVIMH